MSPASDAYSNWPPSVHERIEQQWGVLIEAAPFFASLNAETRTSIWRVWACSEFAARYCVQKTCQFEHIVQSDRLEKKHNSDSFTARLNALFMDIANEAELMQRLREVRNEEMF